MNVNLIQLSFWLLIPFTAAGQTSNAHSLALGIFTNLYQKTEETEFINLTNGRPAERTEQEHYFRIGPFTPALYLYHRREHFSEIELAFFQFEREEGVYVTDLSGPFPGSTQHFHFGVRYGYNFNLARELQATVQPYIGLALLPSVREERIRPETASLYATRKTDLGLLGQLVPRLVIQITDYVIADINAPISLLSASRQQMRLESGNRYLPVVERSRNAIRWLPYGVHIRLGLGVVF